MVGRPCYLMKRRAGVSLRLLEREKSTFTLAVTYFIAASLMDHARGQSISTDTGVKCSIGRYCRYVATPSTYLATHVMSMPKLQKTAQPVTYFSFLDSFRPPILCMAFAILYADLGPRGRPGGGGGGWGRTRYRRHAVGQERSHENVDPAGEDIKSTIVDARACIVAFSLCSVDGWRAQVPACGANS